MVTIHIQFTLSVVPWIIITVTLMCILFKMSCVIIYRHNQLKSLSWTDFSCVFNVDLRSLIHNASEILSFCLLLWKFWSIILNSGAEVIMWLFFAMVPYLRCVVSNIIILYSLCYSTSTFSHIIVNESWFRTFWMMN